MRQTEALKGKIFKQYVGAKKKKISILVTKGRLQFALGSAVAQPLGMQARRNIWGRLGRQKNEPKS